MNIPSRTQTDAARVDLGREREFALGRLTVYPSSCEVEAEGRRETIQPRAMQVLVALVHARGSVVSRDQLTELCWDGRIIGEDAINRAMAKVRAIADLTSPPAFEVETIPRVGFRMKVREGAAACPIEASSKTATAATATGERRHAANKLRLGAIISIGLGLILAAALSMLWVRGTGAPSEPSNRSAPTEASIAVLPFLNMSGDPAKEYFSDGFSEELLNDLSNVPQLRVAARTSSFSFKEKKADIPEIAEKLHVHTVLEGSVREAGDRVRITAQLIDAASGYHLWSQVYDRKLTDILKIQDEIARTITSALTSRLLPERRHGNRTSILPEAYRKYLLGKLYFERLNEADNDRATALFKDVTVLQPDFSDGYAMLGYAYLRGIGLGRTGPEIATSIVEAALKRSLALNPRNLTALIAEMNLALTKQDWDAATHVIHRMQSINPRNVTVARALGIYYTALGFPEQAAAAFRLATQLDPFSAVAWSSLEGAYSTMGHDNDAIAAADAARALTPDSPGVLGWLCVAKADQGKIEEAKPLAARLEQTPEGRQLKGCSMEIARAVGDRSKAIWIVDDRVKKNQGSPAYMGQNYLELGEYKKALPLLRRAYDEEDRTLYTLPLDPVTPRDFLLTPGWQELTRRPKFRAWQTAHDRLAIELATKH